MVIVSKRRYSLNTRTGRRTPLLHERGVYIIIAKKSDKGIVRHRCDHTERGGGGPVRQPEGSADAGRGRRDVGPLEGDGARGQENRREDEDIGEEGR